MLVARREVRCGEGVVTVGQPVATVQLGDDVSLGWLERALTDGIVGTYEG